MNQIIYKVEAKDVDRNYHLAYCTGDPKDIKEVYKDREGYGLELTPIKILNIDSVNAEEIRNLRATKKSVENQLNQINSRLGVLGVK